MVATFSINKKELSFTHQHGGALIIFALVLTMIIVGFTLKSANISANAFQKYTNTSTLLNEAKNALIGYSLSRTGSGERPGDLPLPDRLISPTESGGQPNYDGQTDSCTGVGAAMHCLGRLPWRTLGMSIPDPSQSDSLGYMPWYAASANLLDPTCLIKLNSGVLNLSYTGYVCGGATLPHSWLTVRDSRGNIISNRVAIVVILPSLALTGQTRLLSPLGDVSNYLDTITVPIGCNAPCVPGTYSNADMDDDFIQAEDMKNVPDPSLANPNFSYPYNFNDKLIFITIDELIAAVEKRVAGEARRALNDYYQASNIIAAYRFFPYAAPLGDNNNACKRFVTSGLLPIAPASASCTSNKYCKADFSTITKLEFTNDAGTNYTSASSCTRLGSTCTCTGAGSCTSPTTSLTCDATGACTSTTSGSYKYTYVPKSPDVTGRVGSCIGGAGVVTCNDAGTFYSPDTDCTHSPAGLSKLPQWFTDNNWQDFIYYVIDPTCRYDASPPRCTAPTLSVGASSNVGALLISSGGAIAAPLAPPFAASKAPPADQVRPSTSLSDYLDSDENVNGDNQYDAVGKSRTKSYNDQMFIVAP